MISFGHWGLELLLMHHSSTNAKHTHTQNVCESECKFLTILFSKYSMTVTLNRIYPGNLLFLPRSFQVAISKKSNDFLKHFNIFHMY